MKTYTEEVFHIIYWYTDQALIFFYRIADPPIAGYLFGTFILAGICVSVGKMTMYMAANWNRRRLMADNREMVRMHNLSLRALAAGDKGAYKACNKEANDAFGKYFFGRAALSIASLWPVPFALAWMNTRFAGVDFMLPVDLPGIGGSVGYTFTFIPLYILAYILSGKILKLWKSPQENSLPGKFSPGKSSGEDLRMLTLADITADSQSSDNR